MLLEFMGNSGECGRLLGLWVVLEIMGSSGGHGWSWVSLEYMGSPGDCWWP